MSRLTEKIDIDGMEIKVSKERPLSDQGLGKIIHKLYNFENIEEDLEAIDNTNPSKALEILKDISYFIMEAYSDHEPLKENQRDSRQCFMDYCKNIKQALLKAQEQEKVLNIIKEKRLNFDRFDYAIKHWKTTKEQVDVYNSGIGNCYKLTEEEFDLVNKVFGYVR